LATLFVMETLEQTAVYGHVLGGTLWLGAPILIALAMHVAIGSISALSLAVALSFCADQLVRIARILIGYLVESTAQRPVFRQLEQFCQGHQWLLRATPSDRGPPRFGLLLS